MPDATFVLVEVEGCLERVTSTSLPCTPCVNREYGPYRTDHGLYQVRCRSHLPSSFLGIVVIACYVPQG